MAKKAVVIFACHLGKVGEVVIMDSAEMKAAKEAGYIDDHPNAVAAASPGAGKSKVLGED